MEFWIIVAIIGIPLFIIFLVCSYLWECPAGKGWHNWEYKSKWVNLAVYECNKCGGEMSRTVTQNTICHLEYEKHQKEMEQWNQDCGFENKLNKK